jgi:hypothetical protein
MKVRLFSLLALLFALMTIRCGTITAVRALHKGESALAVSLGGPVTNVAGMNIPLPYAMAQYRYGVDDRFGVYAQSHLLLLALGEIGLDGGFSYALARQKGWAPELGLAAGLTAMLKPGGDERLFPHAMLALSWLAGDRFLTYLGAQGMFQFSRTPALAWAPVLGEEVRLGRSFSLGLEAKWYAPTEITKPRVIDFRMPISGHGAVGFVLGANYHFGGWYE